MAGAEEEEEEKIKKKKQRFDEPCASLENLPFDSVMEMEILPRLSLKSILRLQSASKPLSPLISDHLRRRFGLPNSASGLFSTWPISKNFYHSLDNNHNKFINGTLSFLPSVWRIIDCCNGLLLCRLENYLDGSLVCNPLTGRWASIPNSFLLSYDAVLAFDPRISRHYSILHFRSRKVHIFSSDTGSWVEKKQWASHKARVEGGYPFFFNGEIYFLSYKSPFVKTFDRQGNFLGRIKLPHPEMGNRRRLLGHSGGHLHFAVCVDGEMLVWILEDRDESRWVLKRSVSLQSIVDAGSPSGSGSSTWDLQSIVDAGSGSGSGSSTWDRRWDYLQAFHPDMDVVFVHVKDKLFSYRLDNGDLAEVCRGGDSIFVYSPYYSKDFYL